MKHDAPILAAGACCCKGMEGADGAPAVSEASCKARKGASLRAASCCVRRWNSARMSSSASRPCVCTARDRRSWSLQHATLPQQPLSIIARDLVQPTNTRPQVYSCEALTMTIAMQGITALCHHQSCHLCWKDRVCVVSFLQRDTDAIWCSGVRSSLEHGGLPLQQLAPGLERLELTLLHMAMQNLLRVICYILQEKDAHQCWKEACHAVIWDKGVRHALAPFACCTAAKAVFSSKASFFADSSSLLPAWTSKPSQDGIAQGQEAITESCCCGASPNTHWRREHQVVERKGHEMQAGQTFRGLAFQSCILGEDLLH